MKSPKDYLLLVLALSTVACAVLAWRQYDELVGLRANAINGNERAEWQKRLWAAEKRRTTLEEQAASLKKQPEPADADDAAPGGADRGGPRRNNRPDRAGEFMAMMDKPEVQRLMALEQKSRLDARYASLFKNLNLSPEQLDKFKNLLVEKQTSMMDVLAAARAQGINPRTDPEGFRQMVADAQGEIDTSIKAALGDAGYNQYKSYEQTLPQRNTVSQLEQRLSYSATPLSSSQSEQMVAILTANTPAPKNGDQNNLRATVMAGPAGGMGFLSGGTKITDTVVNQAQGVLAGPQLDALKQLQEEQAAQAQLSQTMRAQFGGGNRTQSGGTATPTTATPANPTPAKTAPGGG